METTTTLTTAYSVYVSTTVQYSRSSTRTFSQPGYVQSQPVYSQTKPGYPQTQPNYPTPYTTVTISLTTISGTPCTAAKYYEPICDCICETAVPIKVVPHDADIITIDDVPCITSKYYEPVYDCVQTATVPVRVATEGEVMSTKTADTL
jgi:hypothetical protein